MLLGTIRYYFTTLLGSSLLGNMLTGKGMLRVDYGHGKEMLKIRYGDKIDFERIRYYQNESRFNGVYLTDNLPKKTKMGHIKKP